MGKYERMAQQIANILEELRRNGEVLPEDIEVSIPEVLGEYIGRTNNIGDPPCDIDKTIPEVLGGHSGNTRAINFYPYGKPGFGCCYFALFLSLQTSAYIKPRRPGHLKCKHAIEKIVQHMQGNCFHKTREVVLITDDWDGNAFQAWKGNLEQIKKDALLEIYLLGGKHVTEFQI